MSQESRRHGSAFSKHWDVACSCELVHSVRLNPVIIQRAPTGQAGTSKSITKLSFLYLWRKVYFVIFIEKFYFFPLKSGLDSFRF